MAGSFVVESHAAGADVALPRLEYVRGAHRLIVNGEPALLLGGELHNSSSSSLEYMERHVWHRLESMRCNMFLGALSWELVEPRPGEFDFALLDGLVDGARKRGMAFIPLWFGAFKNALSTYAPPWVKQDLQRFPRAETTRGRRTEALSCFTPELAALDARAFAAVMRRVRELDPDGATVLMAQVENEVGILRGSRDVSAHAEAAYAGDVPAGLLGYLEANEATLHPSVRNLRVGHRGAGTWAEVFGKGPLSDEVFMAWHFASYVGAVAAAGIAEHPIPMFANAWIVQHDGQTPGAYPSGGPTANMIDVWRAAAPEIAFLAPDIYLPGFAAECDRYAASGNALFVPETSRDLSAAASAWYAVGEHKAIGVAPFGIDSLSVTETGTAAEASFGNPVAATVMGAHGTATDSPLTPGQLLRASYRMLRELAPLLGRIDAENVRGFLEDATVDEAVSVAIELGGYRVVVDWNNVWKTRDGLRAPDAPFICGGGLIAETSPGEFLLAGFGFRARFESLVDGEVIEYLAIDEDDFERGVWQPGRRLNGDEYRLLLDLGPNGEPQARRVVPYRYEVERL